MPARRSIPILVLVTPLGVALGCLNMDLEIEDHDQFTPSGRISYEIYPGLDQRRSGSLLELVTGSPPAPRSAPTAQSAGIKPTIAIDGSIAAVEGRDHEQVPAGQRVELDVVVLGPARVKLNAQNLRGTLAARGGLRFYDVLSLEAIMGLGIDSTEVRLRAEGGADGSDGELRPGFLVGGRATVRPIALFDLYAQYTANLMESETIAQDTEVGFELNLLRNLALFAGYRWWRYEESLSNESDWRIKIRGPTAGVAVRF